MLATIHPLPKWQIGLRIVSVFCLVCGIISVCFIYGLRYDQKTITLETETKKVLVRVELALTPTKQAIGLMYRSQLDPNQGMLFVFPNKKMVYMWMKNTYLPLDMIFFDETGHITHIHENARPLDKTTISSNVPAIGVLEVNAGFVQNQGIKIGQKIDIGKAISK